MDRLLVRKLFQGLMTDETLNKLESNLEEYIDCDITSLGIDSLVFMELVLRIEEISNEEIDFDTFDISSISTIRKILSMIR